MSRGVTKQRFLQGSSAPKSNPLIFFYEPILTDNTYTFH